MVSKADITHWTGLSGAEVDHILNAFKKENLDIEVVDWKTVGEEIRDYADKYGRLWEKLGAEYGISKPILITKIPREKKIAEEAEIESLLHSKEGIKTLLRRIYDTEMSGTERERLKTKLLEASPEWITNIAVWNGLEQKQARRFLGEMVVAPTPEKIKELLKKDTLKLLSSRGWVREINDIPLKKPIRSIDLAEHLTGYNVFASQDADDGRIVVLKREPLIPREIEEKPVEAVSVPSGAKIEDLATKYSYIEVLKMAKEHDVSGGPKMRMITSLVEKGKL